MKVIPVKMKGGYTYALVDDEDYDDLHQFNWQLIGGGYAARHQGRGWSYMHREIMGAQSGEEVDHENLHKRDNQRANLRFATRSQNGFNSRAQTTNKHHSQYIGVSYLRRKDYALSKPWIAYIDAQGHRTYLGYFSTPEDAARARDDAARKVHGKFARLNFEEQS